MGTQEVSRNIGLVESAARDTGGAAGQISEFASDLSHQADILKSEVRRFLQQVRSDRDETSRAA
jgi:methyl-accepting chemotaxis protein